MACEQCNRTGAYLDLEMSEQDRQNLEAHLANCSECSQELARLQRLSAFLSSAATPEINPQQLFWKARNNKQGLIRFAEMLTAAAAVVILICGIWLMRAGSSEKTSSANWERVVITQQFDTPQADSEDPFVQVLLREQP
jgi:anti-sigma factor RsiW